MTKHRRITGFVIVALLAIVATTANVRSHSHLTGLLTAPAMSSTTQIARHRIKVKNRQHPAMSRVMEAFG